MSTRNADGKFGGNWSGKLRFINDMKYPNEIYDSKEMRTLINLSEVIIQIWNYKDKLFSWQLEKSLMFHSFIVFKTNEFYWSIEKTSVAILIQKSKNELDILKSMGKKNRLDITSCKEMKGKFITMSDLLDKVDEEVKNTYVYINNFYNCQGFASRMFEFITNNSSLTKSKLAGVWSSRLFFINDTKSPDETYNVGEMRNLINVSDAIIRISIYKNPLYAWQLTQNIMFHSFVVFKTNEFHWSIEKNSEGIWIQKSKDEIDVLEYFRGIRRLETTLVKLKIGKFIRMSDLLNEIDEEVKISYIYLNYYQNGQGFANRIFHFITK